MASWITRRNRERHHRKALMFVNKLREQYGEDPLAEFPRGILRSTSGCPMAAALVSIDAAVCVNRGRITLRGERHRLPQAVRLFVYDFDRKRYPALIGVRGVFVASTFDEIVALAETAYEPEEEIVEIG